MKRLAVMFILMMSVGCGNTYHLKTGGWKLGKVEGEGTCLVVHDDSDPEVVRVCIAKPEAFKLSTAVLKEHCDGTD